MQPPLTSVGEAEAELVVVVLIGGGDVMVGGGNAVELAECLEAPTPAPIAMATTTSTSTTRINQKVLALTPQYLLD